MPPMTLEAILEMAKGAGIKMQTTAPAEVAEHLFDGLMNDRFYILPATESGDKQVRERMEAMLARRNPSRRACSESVAQRSVASARIDGPTRWSRP